MNVLKMKRIGAMALALVMLMALSVTAFADNIGSNGVVGEKEGHLTSAGEVVLLKELVVKNTDGSNVYLPTVTYNYTIAPATVANGTQVTDADGIKMVVSPGLTGATITETVSFSPDDTAQADPSTFQSTTLTQPFAAPATGVSVYKTLTVDVSNVNFQESGIYRYEITETSSNKTAAGVTNGTDYSGTRFLDVYVRGVPGDNGAGEYASYEVYGMVCFSTNSSIDGTTANNNLDSVGKTTGYTHTSDLDHVADQYLTKNLSVTKNITGAMAEKGHKFPFVITLSSGITGTRVNGADTTGNVTSGFDAGTTNVTLAASNVINAGLSNGKSVILYGIPTEANATVVVKETNDTADVYTMTASVTNSSVTDLGFVAAGEVMDPTVEKTAASVAIDQSAMTAIEFTNAITEISPTGMVLRFAPYAIMLAAGFIFLVLGKRRTSDEAAA